MRVFLLILRPAALLIPLALPILGLSADTVTLKNGQIYRNVKIVPRGDAQFIVFQNGRVMRVENEQVATLQIARVSWVREGVSEAEADSRVKKAVDEAVAKKEIETREKTKQEVRDQAKADYEQRLQAWRDDRLRRLWHSALIPGWAQYRAGADNKAMLFFTGSSVMFVTYFSRRQSHARAQDKLYDNLVPTVFPAVVGTPGVVGAWFVYESRRDTLQNQETRTNRMALILGAFYAWNLIDSLYVGRPEEPKLPIGRLEDNQTRFFLSLEEDSVRFGWRFHL